MGSLKECAAPAPCAAWNLWRAGHAELAAGDLDAAWATAQRALSRYLRDEFLRATGKVRSPIVQPRRLAAKLRSAGLITRSRWVKLQPLLEKPNQPTRDAVRRVLRFIELRLLEADQCHV